MRRQQPRKCCLHLLEQSPADVLSARAALLIPGQNLKDQPPIPRLNVDMSLDYTSAYRKAQMLEAATQAKHARGTH